MDFAAFAHSCGVGYRAEKPQECGDLVEQFLNAPGPAVLEAVVDPLTAPMPGKIKASQALRFAESLARGEPDATEIFVTAMKDRARQLV